MHSARTNKLAAAMICGILTLTVPAAMLLIATHPAQAQTEIMLHSFCASGSNCADGANPSGRLTSDNAGNFYGTTPNGVAWGTGIVFELSPNGSGGWNETVLYSFTGGADGASPAYSYVLFDDAGNLYGTASGGGSNGYGVVFKLSPGESNWQESVLYNFAGGTDGANPGNGLIRDVAGNFYGTTQVGGAYGGGTVFELSPAGDGWTEQVLYSIAPSGYPMTAGLTMDKVGNIFGASGSTVFELLANGNGGWTPTVIHTFTGGPKGAKDGMGAEGTPVFDHAGNLYGTTYNGGLHQVGTVYECSLEKGTWTEKILHSFGANRGDGSIPWGGVLLDLAGDIYGISAYGGVHGPGTVYELVAPVGGVGVYKERILWDFDGTDGWASMGSLIWDSAGNLYGTTSEGGTIEGYYGEGFVFEVTGLPRATATTLAAAPSPSTWGQAVTFTAALRAQAGTPPDGETITFMRTKTVWGTGTLTGGAASFTTSSLPPGFSDLTAVYGGDSHFAGSTSNTVKQQVKNAKTITTLTSSQNPSADGQAVTFTAAIVPAPAGNDNGRVVMFKEGASVLGTGPLANGSASFTTSTLPVGTNLIKAVYPGDWGLAGSTSNTVKQVVENAGN